jgi:hypothetical protein
MNRLAPGIPVTLNVDGENAAVDCVVASLEGRTAMLVQTSTADPKLIARLQSTREGYLVLSATGTVVGLRGTVTISAANRPLIEFVLTDA